MRIHIRQVSEGLKSRVQSMLSKTALVNASLKVPKIAKAGASHQLVVLVPAPGAEHEIRATIRETE
jgi:hypothetical protein